VKHRYTHEIIWVRKTVYFENFRISRSEWASYTKIIMDAHECNGLLSVPKNSIVYAYANLL
jgi:hypothetical protein